MQNSTSICSGTHRIWWYEQVGKKIEMHVKVSFSLGSSISWHSMWRTCTPQATVFVSCVSVQSSIVWLIDWLINQLLQLAIFHMIWSYQLIHCGRPMSCFTAHFNDVILYIHPYDITGGIHPISHKPKISHKYCCEKFFDFNLSRMNIKSKKNCEGNIPFF